MRLPIRRAGGLLAASMVTVLALGTLWWRDRSASWEEPRWGHPGLVRVFPAVADARPRPRGVVPVNPACPHCGDFVAAAARRLGSREALAILIVDAPHLEDVDEPPSGVDEVWWDRGQIWRERWGHRVYGELLRFDERGRYRGSEALLDRAHSIPAEGR